MKIRIGNDFKTKWAITWLGEPEDFSDATDMSLFFNIYDKKIELAKDVDYTITNNIIEIDVTPDICNILGVYNLELHYTKPNDDFIDGERRSAVDIDAFRIVGKSEKADSTQDVSIISDAVAIFLDVAYKKLEEIEANEDVRIANESEREDEESIRVANENIRISNEQDRQINTTTAISNAEQATLNANNSAVYANEQGAYAEEMSLHPPVIIDDYWHIWNLSTNQYESTGQYARGDSAIDGALVVQEKGQSAVNTMSQKAVTDELAQLESDGIVKLENLVVNGDFRDGNNLWETSAANLTGSGKFVATAKDGLIRRRSGNRISYKAGDKIYMAANFKADTPLAWFNSNLGAVTGYFHSGSGLFERQSIIYTAPADYTGNPFLIRIGDGRNSGWTEIEVAYMYALNFTEIFGVGNEPTIEDFESLLNLIGTEYFEGTYNIPSQLVMQWVLGLIEGDYPMLLALDYNLNGAPVYENYTIKSCNIKWVNGMTGVLTFSDFDEVESAFTSFIATCPDLGMRVRQPKVIFDGNGQITNYPSLIVETI